MVVVQQHRGAAGQRRLRRGAAEGDGRRTETKHQGGHTNQHSVKGLLINNA